MTSHIYVAIMAGGIGSRFWPVSRTSKPKQFLDILGAGRTLIQSTFDRFAALVPCENIFVVTSTEYTDIVRAQLPQLKPENILSEPQRKNTAACIAYLSFRLKQQDPHSTVIVAPSDHLIANEELFRQTCGKAVSFARQHDALITLGIKPSYANTGYGYIQFEEAPTEIKKVAAFTEKPDIVKASRFVQSGDYLWNAGIFIWRNEVILDALQKYGPQLYLLFADREAYFGTKGERDAVDKVYGSCDSISIDIAIMEKAGNVFVIPCSFGWSDLGTWNSVYETLEKDGSANASSAHNQILVDTDNCLINVPGNKLVVTQGIKNLIIVDTNDVILICRKENEQEIKNYVSQLRTSRKEQFI